jgi:RNA polymerase sigma-70 factor, ECF subfamily
MADYTGIEETNLVQQAIQNPDAFAVLYHRYLPPLYRYLYRRLSNQRDVEDLTAQVFTEILESIHHRRFPQNGSFPAWLFTIARRRVADFYRVRLIDPLDDPPAPEPEILANVEKGQDLQRLAALLAQLDDDHQELLRLRFSAGLSFSEIGQIVGRSDAAVKMAVYRVLDGLRKEWEVDDDRE